MSYPGRTLDGNCLCCFATAKDRHASTCEFASMFDEAPIPAKKADAIQIDGTHYKDMAMQPWDVMQAVLTKEEFIGFLKGNLIKYTMRDGKKPGALDDAQKAKHYAQKLAEVME